MPARAPAAADAYHAMTEPRLQRKALAPEQAADALGAEANAGRLDPDAVAAVVEAAEHRVPRIERAAGLTERDTQVVGMLARRLQTKQVARELGIAVKTADRHIQNAYAKIRSCGQRSGAVVSGPREAEVRRQPARGPGRPARHPARGALGCRRHGRASSAGLFPARPGTAVAERAADLYGPAVE
jgi:DNA-binding CsgD family transcriptional regulator